MPGAEPAASFHPAASCRSSDTADMGCTHFRHRHVAVRRSFLQRTPLVRLQRGCRQASGRQPGGGVRRALDMSAGGEAVQPFDPAAAARDGEMSAEWASTRER